MATRCLRPLVLVLAMSLGWPVLRSAAAQDSPAAGEIVAAIDDLVVREGDLDAWWHEHDSASYSKVRQDLYDGQHRALDALLSEYLVQREATARGLTPDTLLAAELPARMTPVSDTEIQEAYRRSLPLPGGMTLDQVKPVVVSYLQQQHRAEARTRYVAELREAAHVSIHLGVPRQSVAIAHGDPEAGPVSAPIVLIEFSDFECPFCKQLEPVIRKLRDEYGDRVRLIWKDFPLKIHDHARAAAEAARCAGDQGRFWQFHDVLFANQQALGADDLKHHARDAGLDLERFESCLASGIHGDDVAADIEEGARQGVDGTPTVFINGRPVVGAQAIDVYDTVILEELAH